MTLDYRTDRVYLLAIEGDKLNKVISILKSEERRQKDSITRIKRSKKTEIEELNKKMEAGLTFNDLNAVERKLFAKLAVTPGDIWQNPFDIATVMTPERYTEWISSRRNHKDE